MEESTLALSHTGLLLKESADTAKADLMPHRWAQPQREVLRQNSKDLP